MSRQQEWAAVTVVLLLASVLRVWALGQVPPGLAHDEVANWLIAQKIRNGEHALYFTAAYGHEPLYQYVQAASVALFGDHWLGLRWPSVAFALLGIAATYALIRRLFGTAVALLTAACLAVSFWPLFYARVALRAIALPFIAALSAYFLHRALPWSADSGTSRSATPDWLLAGLFLGLSLYTYTAARVLPLVFAAFLIYVFFLHGDWMQELWPAVLLMLVVTALISAPLIIWLAAHPSAEYRIAEVREPFDRLLAGDPSPVRQNLIANLKSFTFAGDPWPRQNLPGRPVFADPVSAVLFYAGVVIVLWHWRDPRHGFLLIWLVGALGPSVATSVAPSSIRDILGLVVVFVFPSLALVDGGRWLKRKVQDAGSKVQDCRFLLPASCFLLLAPCLFLTARDYFGRWPQIETVRFDYQADLTAVAHQLDQLPLGTPVTVAGLSVHTMDGPSLALAARRDIDGVRLCDTRETLLIPSHPQSDAWLFVPQVVPFDDDLRQRLLAWGAVTGFEGGSSFTSYRLPDDTALQRALQRLEDSATLPDGTGVALPVSFGGQLAFLGYEQVRSTGALTLLSYWRVEEHPSGQLKAFAHLMGASGALIGQDDGLGSPSRDWAPGDLIIQQHALSVPDELSSSEAGWIRIGLYEAETGTRLPVVSTDHLVIPLQSQ